MLVVVSSLLRQAVGTRIRYEIAESPIAPGGEHAGLIEAAAHSVDATLDAIHTDPGILVEGTVTALIKGQCSRCLKDCLTRVHTEFAEQYYATVDVVNGAPRLDPPAEAPTIGSDFRIDLTPLVAEELILATPFAPLCREDCKGLCLACGADLNLGPHAHEDGTDPRWAMLATLEGFHADRE